MKKIVLCLLSMLMILSLYAGKTEVFAKASHTPFYGVWISATKKSNVAKTDLKKAKKKGFAKAKIYLTTDWSNLNDERYYVISTDEYTTAAKANKALNKVKRYYQGAYVKYTGKYKKNKVTKVDQMMIAAKNNQNLKASKIMKTLPKYCKKTGKLSKKAKRLYRSKCRKMKLDGYWYYDITGDGKADLFVYDVNDNIHAYTYKNSKLVNLGSFQTSPDNSMIANPGTDHFYMSNISHPAGFLLKVTYKNKKFKVTNYATYNPDQYNLLNFTYFFDYHTVKPFISWLTSRFAVESFLSILLPAVV